MLECRKPTSGRSQKQQEAQSISLREAAPQQEHRSCWPSKNRAHSLQDPHTKAQLRLKCFSCPQVSLKASQSKSRDACVQHQKEVVIQGEMAETKGKDISQHSSNARDLWPHTLHGLK